MPQQVGTRLVIDNSAGFVRHCFEGSRRGNGDPANPNPVSSRKQVAAEPQVDEVSTQLCDNRNKFCSQLIFPS